MENIKIIESYMINDKYYNPTMFQCLDCNTIWKLVTSTNKLICRFKDEIYAEYKGVKTCGK